MAHHTSPGTLAGSARPDVETAAGVRSVHRAVTLLALFDETHATWSVAELARAAGLPRTTTIRLVGTLQERGLLWSLEDGHVTVGPSWLRWARLAHQVWQLPEPAWQVIRQLSAACGETVNVYVRQGLVRLCVAQQEGTQTVRHVVRVGDALPLWGGAAGRVLLVDADADLIAAVARSSPMGADFAVTLAERVRAAAEAGWSQSHGEREVGASGVAAAIVGERGEVLAALALGGPTSRFTVERVAEFAPAVRAAAARISALGLGWPGD